MTRAPDPATAGRVRLSFVEAEGSFETRSAEAVHPEDPAGDTATSEMPMALTRGEARTAVKRWLTEARIGRDGARFALPPSSTLSVGDIVTLPQGGETRHYRIDRMELTSARAFEAMRIEPGLYRHRDASDDLPHATGHEAPLPVLPIWMDLPLMRGDEVPHAPHLAVTGAPWPGAIAVYDAPAGAGSFALNRTIGLRASIGETLTPLVRATPSLIQRGEGVEVAFPASVGLSSVTEAELQDGRNLAAISTGAGWELFQYRSAILIEPGRWQLQDLLRGQFGTEPEMPDAWAPGAVVVLMDGAPAQVDLAASSRLVARRWRIGPAALAYDDPIYVETTETFAGNGLRPYAPAHLTAEVTGGDLALGWIRRTRSGGDGWDAPEVPLGEEIEAYLLRLRQGGALLREVSLSAPGFLYTAAMQATDGVAGVIDIEVAQVSASYGPGLWARISVAV